MILNIRSFVAAFLCVPLYLCPSQASIATLTMSQPDCSSVFDLGNIYETVTKYVSTLTAGNPRMTQEEKEDIIQDVMVRLLRKGFDNYDSSKSKFTTYVYSIVANMVKDRLKSSHFRKSRPMSSTELDLALFSGPDATPLTTIGEEEALSNLQELLKALSEVDSATLDIHLNSSNTLGQVARERGLSLPAHRSRLLRAREHLRTRLESAGILPVETP